MKRFGLFSLMGIALLSFWLVGCTNTEENNNGDIEIVAVDNSDVIAYNDNLVDIAEKAILDA